MSASQQSRVELLSDLTGLTHDIFVGKVKNVVKRSSITAQMIQDADPGEYRFSGQKMKFATDLRFKTGGMASSGWVPDYIALDAVQGELTPVRRYARFAIDNLIELLASGEGSFQDIGERIFDQLWDSWESQEIRHAIGESSGITAVVDSRTSSTVIVLKDGLGYADMNPLMHISEGSIIAWYDVGTPGFGGAGTITAINLATKAITIDSAATWEPSATVAADDLIFFATTPNITATHFDTERNVAPNGIGTILDPAGSYTTVHGIAESTSPRWKPVRQQSVTFDHFEVMEFILLLGNKRGFDVTPAADSCVTSPGAAHQLAQSLMAFQSQAYTGGKLQGGYSFSGASGNSDDNRPHAGLEVGGLPVYVDGFFFHDVFAILNNESLYRVGIGGEADYEDGDGSMWQRISDYDGKDGYVSDYGNCMSNHRGAHGALTGIANVDADKFAAGVPNY